MAPDLVEYFNKSYTVIFVIRLPSLMRYIMPAKIIHKIKRSHQETMKAKYQNKNQYYLQLWIRYSNLKNK